MMDVTNSHIDDEIVYIDGDDEFIARQWASDATARVPTDGEVVRLDTAPTYEGPDLFVVRRVWHSLSEYNRRIEVYLEPTTLEEVDHGDG